MIDIFHFFWIVIFALGIGILGGEIIADNYHREHPPDEKEEKEKGGESDGYSR